MSAPRLTISVLLLAIVLVSLGLWLNERRSGSGAEAVHDPQGDFKDHRDQGAGGALISDPLLLRKSHDRRNPAGETALAHASNGAVDLRVATDGTFQVSLAGASSEGLSSAIRSPLVPDEQFQIPEGIYIKLRDKHGNPVILATCDPDNWYTPMLLSSKMMIQGADPLVPAQGSSGRVSLSRMLPWKEGEAPVEMPPLSDLEFKLLVRLDPFLFKEDGSQAAGSIAPLETEWLSGSLLK